MKLKLEYGAADLQRAIKHDLVRQGIPLTDLTEVDIKFNKGSAVVTVEITPNETPPSPVELSDGSPLPAPAPLVPPETRFRAPATEDPPALVTIEGGANPVDMTDILRASKKVANNNPGRFPTPQHKMLDGESTDWPGNKEP